MAGGGGVDESSAAGGQVGEPDRHRGRDEIDEPVAGPDEVVVDVEFADVDPLDVWVTRGTVAGGQQPLPFVPGTEATVRLDGRQYVVAPPGAGTVRDGLYRERAAVPRSRLGPLPEGTDPAQAAALGIAGVTALRLVRDVARVGADDRVLVLGASGGVGAMLLQLVRARGATVWGQTGSAGKAEAVTSRGADRAVVTDAAGLVAAVAELQPTVAFDPLAGPFSAALLKALQPFGRLVIFGTSAGPEHELKLRTLYRKPASDSGCCAAFRADPRAARAGARAGPLARSSATAR